MRTAAEYTARYARQEDVAERNGHHENGNESMSADSEGFLSSSDDEDDEEPPTTGEADL
jgi:hypothetical protein